MREGGVSETTLFGKRISEFNPCPVINCDLQQKRKYLTHALKCLYVLAIRLRFLGKKNFNTSPDDRTATSTHIYEPDFLCTLYKLLGQPSRTLSQETIPSTTKGWATLCLTWNAGESNPSTPAPVVFPNLQPNFPLTDSHNNKTQCSSNSVNK